MAEKQIEELIDKVLIELGYEDCFLVELMVNNTKVEAFLDSDESVTYEKCRRISRKVEEVLDEELWLGEKYTLDISSAGVGRPLKFKRQYVKNVGRKIALKTETKKWEGTLTEVKEESIIVLAMVKDSNPKSKKKVEKEIEIAFDDIKESKIKVSF